MKADQPPAKIAYTKDLKRKLRKRIMLKVGHVLPQKGMVPQIKECVHEAVFSECGSYDEAVTRKIMASIMCIRGSMMKRSQAVPRANFYHTPEWIHLRYATLLRGNGKCSCCGRSASDNLVIQVDHIKPKSDYPELALHPDNLQLLCEECNTGKSNWDDTRWSE